MPRVLLAHLKQRQRGRYTSSSSLLLLLAGAASSVGFGVSMSTFAGAGGRYTYQWPRPAVTVDALIFAVSKMPPAASVLLIERGRPPFQGHFALPGGFVDEHEGEEREREMAGWS
jgi:hypothetical protein